MPLRWRHANESSPAPRITYCAAPDPLSQSSAKRERAATQVATSDSTSPNAARAPAAIASAALPTSGHASQSARTARGPCTSRCAPLAHAAIIAVRLAALVSEIPDRSILKP